MRIKHLLLTAALVLTMVSSSFAASLSVKGSTTVLPIMQRAVEAYQKANPGMSISVSGGGSGNGIKAIIDGTTDVAMASRFMKGKEVKLAMEKGVYPVPFAVGIDALVPVVHPSNPVSNLTRAQLKAIYKGEVKNWKDVGGPDRKIVVISRDTSSGTYETWEGKIMNKERVYAGALLQASNGAVAQAVSKNKLAIGYVGLAYVNDELHGLTVDGVEANVKTALNGDYPISRGLNCYTPGQPTGDAKGLLDFMLSPAGQDLAESTGFIKVK